MIILNGLTGPMHVNGQLYKFNGSMPTFGSNFTDEQIAGIIDYLHNSFVPGARPPVKASRIKALRDKKAGVLTEKDLLEMPDSKD
jgi:mono/diheme cytochrome c family protein